MEGSAQVATKKKGKQRQWQVEPVVARKQMVSNKN